MIHIDLEPSVAAVKRTQAAREVLDFLKFESAGETRIGKAIREHLGLGEDGYVFTHVGSMASREIATIEITGQPKADLRAPEQFLVSKLKDLLDRLPVNVTSRKVVEISPS